MAQASVRGDFISYGLFEGFDFRKTALFMARPDQFIIQPYVKDAASTRNQGHFPQFIGKSGEQFLRHPARPQEPAALPTIDDLDPRLLRHRSHVILVTGLPLQAGNHSL